MAPGAVEDVHFVSFEEDPHVARRSTTPPICFICCWIPFKIYVFLLLLRIVTIVL